MPTNRKSERGFASLIVLLISLALIMAIMALVSINLVQIGQAKNEQNATLGVTALMQAEAGYIAAFPSSGYATGTNLHYLSDCPAPVTQNGKTTVTPTAIAACQNVSKTYTNNKAAYGYAFNVVSTVGADLLAGTSDDGYLITATPSNKALGRLTYCANNQDGVLRGQIEGVTPTTAATCDAFGVIAAGVASAPPPAPGLPSMYSMSAGLLLGTASVSGQTIGPIGPLTLPKAGSYHIVANTTVYFSSGSSMAGCILTGDNGAVLSSTLWGPVAPYIYGAQHGVVLVGSNSTTTQSAYAVNVDVVETTTGVDNVYLTCTVTPTMNGVRWQAGGNFNTSGGGMGNWGVGPTSITAILVNNNPAN